MQFNPKNPKHLIAAFMLLISLTVFIILPVLSFAFPVTNISNTDQINRIFQDNPIYLLLFEIILFIMQITIVVILFVFVPILWYKLVNNFSTKKMLQEMRLKLSLKNIDQPLLWGTITALVSLGVIAVMSQLLIFLGVSAENASNIQDIEMFFSLPLILLLITFQPIAEEFFFRGFLLDKFTKISNTYVGIILTSVLFGLAHITNGNVIPAILISCIALVFGYAVVKTNNLMTGIIGHIIFNLMSFAFYIIGKDALTGALML